MFMDFYGILNSPGTSHLGKLKYLCLPPLLTTTTLDVP